MFKNIILLFILSLVGSGFSATASWRGVTISNGTRFGNPTQDYSIDGGITTESGLSVAITASMFGRFEGEKFYLNSYDYSETAVPVDNRWVLTYWGEMLGQDTIDSATEINLCSYATESIGGTVVVNWQDFYLGFQATETTDSGESFFGWLHVSVGDDWKMTLLDSGVNLSGGAVRVGNANIPEPSCALLVLVGLTALALRRQVKISCEI